MQDFDLVIKGGTVVTAADTYPADIAICDGRIAMIGENLSASQTIDAAGKLVLPGGIEAHCHVEQASAANIMSADDFYSGSVSAAFGGNTCFVPFAAQHRGQNLLEITRTAMDSAAKKAVIDYAFHLIISDPTEELMQSHLPELIEQGCTSFKVYMTYPLLKIADRQILDILSLARERGGTTMVHAENDDVVAWLADRLIERGHEAPKFHAVSHHPLAEAEAARRAIDLARLADSRLLIVHVSTEEAAASVRRARNAGAAIFAETCPQYLFLTAEDLDRDGYEGAKFCCSPPPRDKAAQAAMWQGLQNGTFQVFSSDHAPYRFDETGKFKTSPTPTFKQIANGVPGIETRMPLLFSEGVGKGRISLNEFVALTSTNAAKIYGLYPKKGSIVVGGDADLAIWDPQWTRTISHEMLHDNMDYTPYEGRQVTGWPTTVISRGRIVVSDGQLHVERGSGEYVQRAPLPVPPDNDDALLAPQRNFGASLL